MFVCCLHPSRDIVDAVWCYWCKSTVCCFLHSGADIVDTVLTQVDCLFVVVPNKAKTLLMLYWCKSTFYLLLSQLGQRHCWRSTNACQLFICLLMSPLGQRHCWRSTNASRLFICLLMSPLGQRHYWRSTYASRLFICLLMSQIEQRHCWRSTDASRLSTRTMLSSFLLETTSGMTSRKNGMFNTTTISCSLTTWMPKQTGMLRYEHSECQSRLEC